MVAAPAFSTSLLSAAIADSGDPPQATSLRSAAIAAGTPVRTPAAASTSLRSAYMDNCLIGLVGDADGDHMGPWEAMSWTSRGDEIWALPDLVADLGIDAATVVA